MSYKTFDPSNDDPINGSCNRLRPFLEDELVKHLIKTAREKIINNVYIDEQSAKNAFHQMKGLEILLAEFNECFVDQSFSKEN